MIHPIHKVLSTMRDCQVQSLLMGGQACILYGGAEFSRDIDFSVLASVENLKRLDAAWRELRAEVPILQELAGSHPQLLAEARQERPLLSLVREGDLTALEQSLRAEEWDERQADQKYWQPLRLELESIRHPGV